MNTSVGNLCWLMYNWSREGIQQASFAPKPPLIPINYPGQPHYPCVCTAQANLQKPKPVRFSIIPLPRTCQGWRVGQILIRTKCLQGHVLCMKSVSTSHHLMSLFVCLTYVKGECSIRSLLGLEPFGGCSIRPGSPTHPLMTKNNQEIGFSHFISSQREREARR